MTQSEMNECSFKDAKRAEIKLDETYNRLLKQTSHENRHKLKEARRAWTEYRKLQCEFNTLGSSTGSVHPMVVNLCYEGQAIEYTKLLEQQLNCEEGNLSCGGQ